MPILQRRTRTVYRTDQSFGVPFKLNKNSPQAKGLVGWWPRVDSNYMPDMSGYGNHANNEGGTTVPTLQRGRRGIMPYFDGTDDRYYLGSITSNNKLMLASSPFSIAVWAKVNQTGGDAAARFIDKSTGGNSAGGYALSVHYDGSLEGYANGDNWDSGSISVNNKWHHIVFTADGTTWTMYLAGQYFNSELNANLPPNTTAACRFGTWNHTTGREYKGTISDLRVYNRVLSLSEVLQMYAPQTRWDLYKQVTRSPVWKALNVTTYFVAPSMKHPKRNPLLRL